MPNDPIISYIIPTRERAAYIPHSIRTVLQSEDDRLELIVLDNVSTDGTEQIVNAMTDSRLRYYRSERRLSMRDNFERGLSLVRGKAICYIGDDDGVLPFTTDRSISIFEKFDVAAIAARRAHYGWPDLISSRKNVAIIPRGSGNRVLNSKEQLRSVLNDNDYYAIPCLYHGIVKRDLVEKVSAKSPRFFLSSQVDIYSSIALSLEGCNYLRTDQPLIINGGSGRSNGASHFGGAENKESALWKQEDDLGFLPGYEDFHTVGTLLIESAIVYSKQFGVRLSDIFSSYSILETLSLEAELRTLDGRGVDKIDLMFAAADLEVTKKKSRNRQRFLRIAKSFWINRPVSMEHRNCNDIYAASHLISKIVTERSTAPWNDALDQIRSAIRLGRS